MDGLIHLEGYRENSDMALIIGTSDYLQRTTNLPALYPITFTGWVQFLTDPYNDGTHGFFFLGDDPETTGHSIYYYDVPELKAAVGSGNSTAVCYNGSPGAAWTWFAMYITNTSGGKATWQPVGSSDSFQALGAFTSQTTETLHIGRWAAFSNSTHARMLAVKIWTAVLTEEQISAERLWYEPQVTSNVHAWYPLISNGNDYSVNGYHMSNAGSPTYTDATPSGMNPLSSGRNPVPMGFVLE
jgi:hypothetical protein